jgi:hypothetical protein
LIYFLDGGCHFIHLTAAFFRVSHYRVGKLRRPGSHICVILGLLCDIPNRRGKLLHRCRLLRGALRKRLGAVRDLLGAGRHLYGGCADFSNGAAQFVYDIIDRVSDKRKIALKLICTFMRKVPVRHLAHSALYFAYIAFQLRIRTLQGPRQCADLIMGFYGYRWLGCGRYAKLSVLYFFRELADFFQRLAYHKNTEYKYKHRADNSDTYRQHHYFIYHRALMCQRFIDIHTGKQHPYNFALGFQG